MTGGSPIPNRERRRGSIAQDGCWAGTETTWWGAICAFILDLGAVVNRYYSAEQWLLFSQRKFFFWNSFVDFWWKLHVAFGVLAKLCFECLWPPPHNSPKTWAWWPPWVAFGLHSGCPASPPDYHGNHLIWVDPILIVPLGCHAICPREFPLRFICRTVYACWLLCLIVWVYCLHYHITFCSLMSYSSIVRISLLDFFNADFCWLSFYC